MSDISKTIQRFDIRIVRIENSFNDCITIFFSNIENMTNTNFIFIGNFISGTINGILSSKEKRILKVLQMFLWFVFSYSQNKILSTFTFEKLFLTEFLLLFYVSKVKSNERSLVVWSSSLFKWSLMNLGLFLSTPIANLPRRKIISDLLNAKELRHERRFAIRQRVTFSSQSNSSDYLFHFQRWISRAIFNWFLSNVTNFAPSTSFSAKKNEF